MPRSRLIALAAVAALAVAGVLAVVLAGGESPAPEPELSATQPRTPAGSADAEVVRAWADTLAVGDVAGATRLFAVPAIVQPDPAQPGVRMTRRAQVRAFNAALPCGAVLVGTEVRGRYTVATFRLVERVGAGPCDAPGATASTAFLIRDGRIVEWRRVADPPATEA